MDGSNIQTANSQEIPCETDIPNFHLLGRGTGIDEKEFYIITHSANDCYLKKQNPLSDAVCKQIKRVLGGEWMCFSMLVGAKGFDFSLTVVTGNDFLSFIIDKVRFQVCRLRE